MAKKKQRSAKSASRRALVARPRRRKTAADLVVPLAVLRLQAKVAELETSSDDLNNLLASSQIISLCFDRELRLRWFSPTARAVYQLRPNDIGRALSTLPEAMIGPSAVAAAQEVLNGRHSVLTAMPWQQRWYARRIVPYRSADEPVGGVIVTLSDITEIRAATESLLAERAQQAAGLEQGIMERTSQLRDLSVALTLAEERERRAVAMDLHDDLGQTLALLKIRLDLLRQKAPKSPIRDELQAASEMLEQAGNRVRTLAFQLSPSVLHELGLIPALEWFADEMKRLYHVDVIVDADAGARRELDLNLRTLLFRSVRELLVNVGKHAKTGAARVECRSLPGELLVTVADKGKGFDPAKVFSNSGKDGFGLISVRERLAAVGGTLHCESIAGDGSRVILRLPLARETTVKGPRW